MPEVAGPVRPRSVNLLGVTPLDFSHDDEVEGLRAFCKRTGRTVVSCWAMGSSLDELTRAGEAEVNLVVSATGLAAAKVLRERYGTPYVVGRPQGADQGAPQGADAFDEALTRALDEAARADACSWPCRDLRASTPDGTRIIIGEPVAAGSEAAALELSGAQPLRVVCMVEAPRELLGAHDVLADGEEDVEVACAQAELAYADAFYREVLPAGCALVVRPHLAFSGRNALT